MLNRLLALLFILLFSSALLAETPVVFSKKNGWRESYGGDSTVSEFQNIAYNTLSFLEKINYSKIDKVALEQAITNVDISCGQNLTLDGIPKDAINYPHSTPQKIIIDCPKWNSSNYKSSNKIQLVIHEYLHLLLIDDSNYLLSSEIKNLYMDNAGKTIPLRSLESYAKDCKTFDVDLASISGAYQPNKPERKVDPLWTAIASGCPEITKEIINSGVPYDYSRFVYDPLETLFQSLARMDASSENWKAFTETFETVVTNYPELINTQISKNINMNCRNNSTLLHALAYSATLNMDLINKLVSFGYSLNQENDCAQTPKFLILYYHSSSLNTDEELPIIELNWM